ncbi:MAG: hypothetical protein ABJL54_01815 [Halioglobus sp.]
MSFLSRTLAVCLIPALLSGCFKTQLGGTVAGASVTVTDLRTGEVIEAELRSRSLEDYLADNSRSSWNDLDDLNKMINLGNFEVEPSLYSAKRWYVVTATGGGDMDTASDGRVDKAFTAVNGEWRALMTGRQLKDGGFKVTTITEALYQVVKDELDVLGDKQLRARLNQQTRLVLPDLNDDGATNYEDALGWSVLVSKNTVLAEFSNITALAQAIRGGDNQANIQALAQAIFAEPLPNPLTFYTDKISTQIVQARCVNCHTSGGVASNSGSRLLVVTNSNSDYLTINNQAFQRLAGQLRSDQDLSDYVTGKASNQISHGGGRQLSVGSQQLLDLETYLNLIE